MRYVSGLLYAILFVALCMFGIKNTDSVSLNLYFGGVWQVPLILLLFVAWLIGVAVALLAVLGTFIRDRREIFRLKRELRSRSQAESEAIQVRPDVGPESQPGI
jgi:lipopolysaccharide assembly protein A